MLLEQELDRGNIDALVVNRRLSSSQQLIARHEKPARPTLGNAFHRARPASTFKSGLFFAPRRLGDRGVQLRKFNAPPYRAYGSVALSQSRQRVTPLPGWLVPPWLSGTMWQARRLVVLPQSWQRCPS